MCFVSILVPPGVREQSAYPTQGNTQCEWTVRQLSGYADTSLEFLW